MQHTPNANRLHIAIFGRRNVGKSSLINAITGQDIALVSNISGTTTDPVYKAMELLPLGPVVIIDTAGIDDQGEIGTLRVKKTKEVISKTDIALVVFSSENTISPMEHEWVHMLKDANIPVLGVINKIDIHDPSLEPYQSEFDMSFVKTCTSDPSSIERLKTELFNHVPFYEKDTILGDLIEPGDLVLLVAPQDIQAPKGRLILPQVQTLRDILDHKGLALTVTDDNLEEILSKMKHQPDLVVTDSQVFEKVNKVLPKSVPLTSFSILMSRYKGDLETFIAGAHAISNLQNHDKVLIAEACTHHPLQGDIAREKLPKWLKEYTGKEIETVVKAGIDFGDDLSEYQLIIHCGGCMFNRKHMMSRIIKAKNYKIPITNYGTAIAYMNGILDKVTGMYEKKIIEI